jgi:hypothetical protein
MQLILQGQRPPLYQQITCRVLRKKQKMLKKALFLFALLFINVKTITAQTLSAGPIIGATISTLTNSPNIKSLVGVSVGGFATYSVN